MKTKLPTAAEIKEVIHCDSVHKTKGVYVAKRFFFYHHGMSAQQFKESVQSNLENGQGNWDFKIINFSEEWNAWPKDSWFEVRFTLSEAKDDTEYDARFIPTN